jgi:cell division protein FtsB
MNMSKARPKFNFGMLLLIGMILIFVFMMMDLDSRVSQLFRLSDQRDQAATEVSKLQATEVEMQRQVEFAKSDVAVGIWARNENMGKPGDKLLKPLPGTKPTPTPEITPTPNTVTSVNWQIWRALFFGQ